MNEATDGRQLGFWICLALVVGNMIGSGIFLLPANLAPYGINAIWGWLITIGGALCLVRYLPSWPRRCRMPADLSKLCCPSMGPRRTVMQAIYFHRVTNAPSRSRRQLP
jgi:hypothetical protein